MRMLATLQCRQAKAVQYSTVQCSTVQYSVAQYSTVFNSMKAEKLFVVKAHFVDKPFPVIGILARRTLLHPPW